MNTFESLIESGALRYEAGLLEIVESILLVQDRQTPAKLITYIQETKNKSLQGNCIKILYEVARVQPDLVADYVAELLGFLDSKNNRLVWGAMYALDGIALLTAQHLMANMTTLLSAMDQGSRITIDGGIKVLAKLSLDQTVGDEAFEIFADRLTTCDSKKFPAYVEEGLQCKKDHQKQALIQIILNRMDAFDQPSHIKRLTKVMKKLEN